MTLIFDHKTLAPRQILADPTPRSLSAGPSLSGVSLPVLLDTGLWQVELQNIPVNTAIAQRYWRGLKTVLGGRAGTIAVPVGGAFIAPWPLGADGKRKPRATVTHSDGSTFGDGSTYAQDLIVATLRAAALRATTVIIDLVDGQALEPGHRFGIGDDRAHEIVSATNEGAVWTCTITPPLRAAVTAGERARFDMPRVKCRLATDGEMNVAFELDRFATPTIRFVEAL